MSDSANTSFPEIRQLIDNGPMSGSQYLILLVCFLLNVADGFDVLVMSYAAPALQADWSVDASKLGIIFSAALAGMTIGAMFLSSLSDKLGRRTIILWSVALTSLSMLSTPYASSISQLVGIRFITGLGIGGILASATSIASEFSPARYRSFAVIFVTAGYSVGSVIAGPIASHVIGNEGWQQLFFYGGVLTSILFVLTFFFIPESIEYTAAKTGDDTQRLAKVNALLTRIKRDTLAVLPVSKLEGKISKGNISNLLNSEYRRQTIQLWLIFFTAFWSTYFLVNWIPTLFVNSGLTQKQGIFALTIYTLGGLGGALSLGYLSTKINLAQLITTMFIATATLLAVFVGLKPDSLLLLNGLVLIIGYTFTGGFTGMYAVAAQNYPTEIRTTGVGWCIGLGRFGAILSPLVAGLLVSAGWGMYDLFLFIAIPPVLLSALLLWKLERSNLH